MTTVSSGQTQFVSPGQTVCAALVLSGGTEYVSFGGTADATLLSGVIDDYGDTRATMKCRWSRSNSKAGRGVLSRRSAFRSTLPALSPKDFDASSRSSLEKRAVNSS
jgi:autotransporter passenger strand-loop-strand repeat protein